MIDVKELQIGDWVLYTEFGKNKPTQVEDIESSGRVWLKGENEYTTDAYIDPIPFTEEIIKKNDINEQGWDLRFIIAKSKRTKSKKRENIIYINTYRYNNDTYEETDVLLAIRYVHELQHVLRVCKIDKEIVL